MTDRPMAVVFQDELGGTHELWVPPGFAFVVTSGGILVIHEEKTVAGIVSARPLRGEADADQGKEPEGERDDRLDEPGPDDGGFLDDQEGGHGGGGVGDPDEGDRLHREAARRDARIHEPDCPCDFCYDLRQGATGDVYREPDPDDIPDVTV